MNRISVKLLHYTPMLVLLKALTMPYKNKKADLTLAEKVLNAMKHESVGEHVYISFLIDGVSRSELQEHMRHRIASTTCESTRFTLQKLLDDFNSENDEKMNDFIDRYFVIPEFIPDKWQSHNHYFRFIQELRECYEMFVKKLDYWKDEKVDNDYIKFALPEGYRTRFVWTINLRSLNNFIKLRSAPNAHFEIQSVANKILNVLKNTYVERLVNSENLS